MPSPLQIDTFTLGPWMTNCYVLRKRGGTACWIIDAGFDPDQMIAFIQANALKPLQVVLTHAHVDHIAGLSQVRDAFADIPIVIHRAEEAFLTDPMLNLSAALAEDIIAPEATGTLADGQTLSLDGVDYTVLHTPGHSPGGITLYQPDAKLAIVGDALFAGSIGRTDFPTSNHDDLVRAIKEKLYTLPDDVTVYPGHGPTTTIGEEKRSNPYVRAG